MKRIHDLQELVSYFSEDKKFIHDGYYRIRVFDKETIELAFLVAGPCGDSLVHPQITVSLTESSAIAIKMIDMYATPPLFLDREESNKQKIDQELDKLIEKFLNIKNKNTKIF
ncbi:hypothetical protein [Enterococcus wangshanyuanii]|uniref:NIF system FeS cluster assembly NifU N-terminal domain-containing protein n=1 Tax=Enterococcus wangshanyuanii TaxID=2005703 RepID=A0ABQ1PVB5_9ENTE|nr:hypothetical protein [Enterococcus wangshanyuanii]GGD05016.1 hypothetical protein GCM10011573_38160 [Enterococcus wangshanyuanii]